jgi:hypothetical protein
MDQDAKTVRQSFLEELECTIAHEFSEIRDTCGYPYVGHCLFVAARAREISLNRYGDAATAETAYIIGLCHDVYEDLPEAGQREVDHLLDALFPDVSERESVRHWLALLTHKPSEPYAEYFERITHSRMASVIKAADAHHNGMIARWKFRLPAMTVAEGERVREKCAAYEARSARLLGLLERNVFDED